MGLERNIVNVGGMGFQTVKKHGQDGRATCALTQKSVQSLVVAAKHRKAMILSRMLHALGKWGKLYVNARALIQGVAIGVLLGRCIEIQRLEKLGEHLRHIALASIFKTGMNPLLVMK